MKLKEVKNKINATQNIYGLTQAMELIAAMKVRKLKNATLNSRPFVRKSIELLIKLIEYQKSLQEDVQNNLQDDKKNNPSVLTQKILAVVFASDKGFCGVYNKNILRYAQRQIEQLKKEGEVELITIGKKTTNFFKTKKYTIKMEFPDIKEFEEKKRTDELFKYLEDFYQKGAYKKILLFATHYFTSFVQSPRTVQVFPADEKKLREMMKETAGKTVSEKKIDYIFEPSFEEIFDEALSQLMAAELYHAVLEARTSEEASRMMAMKRAMDNAKEVIKNLTLEYNKARQAQITSEVSEITSAKEAIE
ncbi:MAG TPA: ATP synthase F1 subunit gamma [Candidatus Paceibacterota bacterium]|nr:ATP synthase F1 subunit gamma [Candidatus Pacearchaeota archaeon]HPZ74580.1 ATP synthase F1 subunit gamma [Candidatus Pacearchaeota archaeon]HQD89164.1 ATP synthase F1 subunit gamma [Candidatus Pacearchaeota archaeon]HRR39339.1 ATP synthase F1 subunit gamma [Candidatus Paceibacterota bacterium]